MKLEALIFWRRMRCHWCDHLGRRWQFMAECGGGKPLCRDVEHCEERRAELEEACSRAAERLEAILRRARKGVTS